MSRNTISKSSTPLPLTGSQRQQRYREAQKLCSIDVSRATLATLNGLRARIGVSTDKVIAAALEQLTKHMDEACSGGADLSTAASPSPSPSPAPAPFGDPTDEETAQGSTRLSPGDVIGMHPSHPTLVGVDRARNRRGGGSDAANGTPAATQYELGLGLE